MIYEMRLRKPKPTPLLTQGIVNLPHHIGMVLEELAVSYTVSRYSKVAIYAVRSVRFDLNYSHLHLLQSLQIVAFLKYKIHHLNV